MWLSNELNYYPVYYMLISVHISCLGLNSNHPLLGFTCNKCIHSTSTLNTTVGLDNCDLPLCLVFELDELLLGAYSPTFEHKRASQNPPDNGLLTGFVMDEKGLRIAAFNVQHYTRAL